MKRLFLIALLVFTSQVFANPLLETRRCYTDLTQIPRYVNGRIKRSGTVLKYFMIEHPCPSTGLSAAPCPSWSLDHVLPLAEGGCDAVANLQWLPNSIKSGTDKDNKDRWERKIYAIPFIKYEL